MSKPDRNRDIKSLLLWLRAERITWQALTYGDVTIDGAQDMKLLESLPPSRPVAPRQTIIEKFGGELLKNPAPVADTFLPVVEEDDD